MPVIVQLNEQSCKLLTWSAEENHGLMLMSILSGQFAVVLDVSSAVFSLYHSSCLRPSKRLIEGSHVLVSTYLLILCICTGDRFSVPVSFSGYTQRIEAEWEHKEVRLTL